MIDFSETLNDDQLGDIIQSIFNNFKKVIVQEFPMSKNCESIIIDANINKVFDFCTSFKYPLLGNEIISDVKFEGDPRKVGSKIMYLYLQKFKITNIIQEINGFTQEGNEDDNNEWNYKYNAIFEDGESEIFNTIFISCENGSKTYFSLENDINEKVEQKEIEELSKRKLLLLNSLKKYFEKK